MYPAKNWECYYCLPEAWVLNDKTESYRMLFFWYVNHTYAQCVWTLHILDFNQLHGHEPT